MIIAVRCMKAYGSSTYLRTLQTISGALSCANIVLNRGLSDGGGGSI